MNNTGNYLEALDQSGSPSKITQSKFDGKTGLDVNIISSSLVQADGTSVQQQATENGATSVGNAVKKFRDGFADLDPGAQPDSTIWDVTWTNQGESTLGRAGDTQGASYMKISLDPLTAGSELTMTTKRSFKFPMRFINMLSASQRAIGQEFEVSIVGVDGTGAITTLTPRADLAILGTVTIASNIATINFASDHNLKTGDRVILVGNTERRLNVGPVTVTVVTTTQITVPCTLASATYAAGGVVRWADPIAYAKNGTGLLHEGTTTSQATFFTRRNGFNTRLLTQTIATTNNTTAINYADPFNGTSMNQFIVNQEEVTIVPRSPDSIASPASTLKWHQGLPDEELEYKIRIRAKNLDNITRPVARIVSIAKTGTTTATVTTDVAHGLATTDFVQIYGVRDITNFPNLTTSTQVASIVSPTVFTIVIGAAVTATSNGGTVVINQGSQLALGISAVNTQSISRTNNILTLVGNGTWSGYLPGETIHLYGCDATSMGLYDGAYKVLRINTTALELESIGANFGSINCGGAVMRRTDIRVHAVSQIEYTRHIVELSNSQGSSDTSKSVPVVISTGNISTLSTVASVTSANLGIPVTVADVASAAITTTTTTSSIIPGSGISYEVNIPVTAVSGTNPTMDVTIEESDDTATNWYKVYDFPRITAAGIYRSPLLPLIGNRVRYVQTLGGTTPSFTRAINRLQSSHPALAVRQLIDRTINLTALNSTTPTILARDCGNATQLVINVGAITTTAPALQLEGSDDFGLTWYAIGSPLTAVASSTVQVTVSNINAAALRARVSTAGVGVTAGYVMIKAHD